MARNPMIGAGLLLLGSIFLLARPSMAGDLIYPDGSKIPFEKVGLLRKFPELLHAMNKLPAYSKVVLTSSTPPCPSAYYWTSTVMGEVDRAGALGRCEAFMDKVMQNLSAAVRQACKCGIASEGQTQAQGGVHLRMGAGDAADALSYATAKLVERGPGGPSDARGVFAISREDGSARLYNQDLRLMCTAKSELSGETVQVDCGKGAATGAGKYRLFRSARMFGGGYALARIELAPSSKIDIAINITDEELSQFHPRFPEWP